MMNPNQLMSILRRDNGLEELLLQSQGDGPSPAELIADIINIQRMDCYKLGQAEDVEIDIKEMTPERAAEMVSDMVNGDGGEDLLRVFTELEKKRGEILEQKLTEEEMERWRQTKKAMMNSRN